MKKLLFVFALMFGAMFSSCGNTTKNVEQKDSTAVDSVMVVDTIPEDSATQDTLALDTLHV